jgi:teichuronic acid exporter
LNLKQKTVSGLIWSFIDQFANLGLTFVVGIILARLLSPREFGLIGMITVFIAVSESFIDSGFSSALIRKKNCTQTDYSTVFFFNLFVGIVLFVVLFFTAPAIGNFFNEPELEPIVQVLGIVLIIDSLTLIQRTILIKRIDFKLQARISVIASVSSGIIAITMAFYGFGIWSLVALRLSKQVFNSIFLWMWNRWKPIMVFSKQSFKELFAFGSNIMLNGLLDTLFQNINSLVIGKFYSAQDLGFYTRSVLFRDMLSKNLNNIIGRVTYPVLSEMQDEKTRLKTNYQKIIRSTMFITFMLMLGLVAIAEPLIITLIGEKWRQSIIYLQLLCLAGMLYPLQALNLNMLQVQGRSDLFLKLGIIRKFFTLPGIIIAIFIGIEAMIGWAIFNTFINYYLNSYYSGKMLNYPMKEQVTDILPSFVLSLVMMITVYLLGLVIPFAPFWKLIIQLSTGALFIFITCELTQFKDYMFLKELVFEKIKEIKNRK